jgi:hypothetical protein
MRKLWNFFRKRGFTFAEAMVVLIIGGYCLLPIMGTLQNSVKQTQDFDHHEKLRILARARLNEALVKCSYLGTAYIETETKYHYIYQEDNDENIKSVDSKEDPNTYASNNTTHQIIYSYKTDASFEHNLKLKNVTGTLTPEEEKSLTGQPGLKAIVVSATWLGADDITTAEIEYDDEIDIRLSQFSLINLPIPDGDKIYACDPAQCRIVVIDPKIGAIINTFTWPLFKPQKDANKQDNRSVRPGNIAISPNAKYLAIQFEDYLKILCVNESDPDVGKFVSTWDFKSYSSNKKLIVLDGDKDFNKKLQEHRGVAFRPDGKYVYVTSEDTKKVYILSFNSETGAISRVHEEIICDKDKYTDIHAGQDGWLYISAKDKKEFYRFQMFPEEISKTRKESLPHQDKGGNLNNVQAICTTREGRNIIGIGKDNSINWYDSETKNILRKFQLTYRHNKDATDIIVGGSSNYAYVPIRKWDKNKSALVGFKLPPDGGTTNPTDIDSADVSSGLVNYAFPGKSSTIEVALDSSLNQIVLDRNLLPEIYLIDEAGIMAGTYQNTDNNNDHNLMPPSKQINFSDSAVVEIDVDNDGYIDDGVDLGDADVSCLAVRNPEYLLVGTDDKKIEFVDIYAEKLNEEKTIEVKDSSNNPYIPINLAINPSGSRVKVIMDENPSLATSDRYRRVFDTFTGTAITTNIGSHGSDSAIPLKNLYSIDKGASPYEEDFTAGVEGALGQGIFSITAPNGTIDDNNSAWKGLDIIALNDGGFITLSKHNSGNGQRMLRWYGKHRFDPDGTGPKKKGDYELFATWYTPDGNFPPANSYEMAISADDSILAFAVDPASGYSQIYLYDFNAQNFDSLTQMKGLINDYRTNPNIESAVQAGRQFTGSSRKLKNAFTINEIWPDFIDTPLNFYSDATGGPGNTFDTAVAFRTFGYFRPKIAVQKFAAAIRDGFMLYIQERGIFSDKWTSMGESTTGLYNIDVKAFDTVHITVTHQGNDYRTGHALMTSNSATSFSAPSTPGSNSAKYGSTSGWSHISADDCIPFKFRPQLLKTITIANSYEDDIGLVFSRDKSFPVLYAVDPYTKKICIQALGFNEQYIELPQASGYAYCSRMIEISADGQRLMVARKGSENQIFIIDISMPTQYNFNATISRSSSDKDPTPADSPFGFGDILARIQLPGEAKCIATRPYNRYKSISDKFETINKTLPKQLCGTKIAAMGDEGIYIMGGSEGYQGTDPYKKIFRFNPISPTNTTLTKELNAFIPHPCRNGLTFSYDSQIFTLFGNQQAPHDSSLSRYSYATSGNSFVQMFDISTKATFSEKGNYLSPAARMNPKLTGQSTQSSYPTSNICDNNPSTQWRSNDDADSGAFGNDVNFTVEFDKGPKVKPTQGAVLNPSGEGIQVVDFDYGNGGWTSGPTINMSSGQWNAFNTTILDYYGNFKLDIEEDYDDDMHICEYELIGDFMRKTTRDNLTTFLGGDVSGGCMTPYGFIWAGGSGTIEGKSGVYWPHVVRLNTVGDNNIQFNGYGINRDLPDLPSPPGGEKIANHSIVWHKGSILLIGADVGQPVSKVLWFSIEENKWLSLHSNDGKIHLSSPNPRSAAAYEPRIYDSSNLLSHLKQSAVCSHGDEIFIFGGDRNGTLSNKAYAWNPETGNVRELTGFAAIVGNYKTLISAVSCGPHIYLFGGSSASLGVPGNVEAVNKIYRYTP